MDPRQRGRLSRAESRGIIVRGEGTLQLGPRSVETLADSLDDDLVGGADQGRLGGAGRRPRAHRSLDRERRHPPVGRLPVGQVLSLAPDGDGVLAGTGPEGNRLSHQRARRHRAVRAHRRALRVGARARAGRGAWYAATGTLGRLLRIENGAAESCSTPTRATWCRSIADGAGRRLRGRRLEGPRDPRARRRHLAHGLRRARGRGAGACARAPTARSTPRPRAPPR